LTALVMSGSVKHMYRNLSVVGCLLR